MPEADVGRECGAYGGCDQPSAARSVARYWGVCLAAQLFAAGYVLRYSAVPCSNRVAQSLNLLQDALLNDDQLVDAELNPGRNRQIRRPSSARPPPWWAG